MAEVQCPECGGSVTTRTLERRPSAKGREVELVEVPHRCSNPDCRYSTQPFPFGSFWGRDNSA